MPLAGQLIFLQYRLTRAARMFFDPMLNLGLITPEDAQRVLYKDKFDQQAFHDFVLAQGLLPPQVLKDAVMTRFVPSQL